MEFKDSFFDKVEKKTKVDKDTILSLANKLQKGNMKDKNTLKEVIKEQEEKIISTIVDDKVPKDVEKMF